MNLVTYFFVFLFSETSHNYFLFVLFPPPSPPFLTPVKNLSSEKTFIIFGLAVFFSFGDFIYFVPDIYNLDSGVENLAWL